MKQNNLNIRHSERGSAGAKLIVFAVLFILVAHVIYNFVPVAYQGQSFKQDMDTAVIQAYTLPANHGKPEQIAQDKLKRLITINNLPIDTFVDVKAKGRSLTVRVYYVKKVPILPFGLYEYDYVFDYTATPQGFLDG